MGLDPQSLSPATPKLQQTWICALQPEMGTVLVSHLPSALCWPWAQRGGTWGNTGARNKDKFRSFLRDALGLWGAGPPPTLGYSSNKGLQHWDYMEREETQTKEWVCPTDRAQISSRE